MSLNLVSRRLVPRIFFQRTGVLTVALATVLSVAGCTSGLLRSHAAPVRQYVLHITAAPAARSDATAREGVAARPSLRVLQPLPAPGLDTDHIALELAGNRMDYYAAVRWNGPVPDVVAGLALDSLRDSPAWGAIVGPGSPFNADYQLQISVSHFEADYSAGGGAADSGAAPVIHVSLNCLLTRRADGAIVASFTAQSRQPARENRMGGVVAAFEAAVNEALGVVTARVVP
jgi:cholesterol transport system auxiliary component